VDFLRKRYQELHKHHLFAEMQYSESPPELAQWMPLVMEGREKGESVAATRALLGTDVNLGSLTRSMIDWLQRQDGVSVHLNHRVNGLNRCSDERWHVHLQNKADGAKRTASRTLSFSARAAARCRFCRRRTFPRPKGSAASQ
jgi:malate dehydrogenase (quinone)